MPDIISLNGVLRLPDHIHFGAGARASVAPGVRRYGRRAVVVCDPFLSASADFAQLLADLEGAGVSVHIETGVVPELPTDSVTAAAVRSAAFKADVVVGYGGGSALDLAKLVALLLAHGGELSAYYGENAVPGPVLPLIAVPTTAGTGSEVTPVAVVSDPARELKVGVSSPHLVPRVAVVDPELTMGAPASVSAHAGIDAFVHAVEAFTASVRPPEWSTADLPVFVGKNALSDVLAIEAVQLLGSSLRRVVADGTDRDARADAARGSLLAGMAFASAGTHLSHALQYPIGAMTKTPHGLGTGLMLPYVMQAVLPASTPQLALIGRALGVPADEEKEQAQAAVDAIASLTADIGIPATLADIGIEASELPRIAELAASVTRLASNSMLDIDRAALERILRAAHSGERAALTV